MPIQVFPRTGLYGDVKIGSSGWGAKKNYNTKRLEQLLSPTIKGELADSSLLPGLPADGDMYFIQDSKNLALWIMGSWFQEFTPKGLHIYNSTTDTFFYYNGNVLVAV